MTDYDRLITLAKPWARNVPEPALITSLREACRTLCAATRIWRATDVVTVTTPEETALATLADSDIALVLIEAARLDDTPLTPASVHDLDVTYPGWRVDTDESNAQFITQLEPPLVSIYPRATGELTTDLVLQPSLTATEIPQFLIDGYGTLLARAAAGMQLALPATEYQNLPLAGELLAEFERQTGRQHIISRKGPQRARLRTRGQFV